MNKWMNWLINELINIQMFMILPSSVQTRNFNQNLTGIVVKEHEINKTC